MTTPEDSAAVTPETARVMEGLESIRSHIVTFATAQQLAQVDAAIDRLIVLDNARPSVKDSLTDHPREIVLNQDATRGNFRKPTNNDHQSDGA